MYTYPGLKLNDIPVSNLCSNHIYVFIPSFSLTPEIMILTQTVRSSVSQESILTMCVTPVPKAPSAFLAEAFWCATALFGVQPRV